MKRILIVDDAAVMRAMLRMVLEKNGFEVVGEAVNGEDAIQRYLELKPDIVTMDITMPEMSGVEAVKALTSLDPASKVVMISALGQESLIREAIKNGAKYFIVKPFNEATIVETLGKIG